jgi:hypothetical protein
MQAAFEKRRQKKHNYMNSPAVDRREIYPSSGDSHKNNCIFEVFDSGMRHGNTIADSGRASLFTFKKLLKNLPLFFNLSAGVDSVHDFGNNFLFGVRF